MDRELLAKFLWIGDRLINLSHVAQFRITDNGTRVCLLLAGVAPEDSEVTVDGQDAAILIEELNRAPRIEAPIRPFAQLFEGKKKDT